MFAVICIVFFIVFFIAGIIDIIKDFESIDVSIPGLFALCIPAYLFWKIPDWVIKIFQRDSAEDPSKEVQTIKVNTGYDKISYKEITDKNSREKYVTEDRQGRVIFDSTQRPIRLIFGGGALIIFLIIAGLIFFLSDDKGDPFLFFMIPGLLFILAAIGYVYEVTINKNLGIADRKAGWFILFSKRRFNLTDFSQVVVTSTFYRERRDAIEHYYPRYRDPKFSVYLMGKKVLSLRVFSSLTSARHMGEDVSAYLKLPLNEESSVRI